MARILIIDDDLSTCRLLSRLLTKEGYEVTAYQNPLDALKAIDNSALDLVITDIAMPEMDGIEVLEKIKKTSPSVDVIMITAYASIESAVEAIRKGAYDYVVKPFQNDDLLLSVKRVIEKRRLLEDNIYLKSEISKRYGVSNIIGRSPAMQEIFAIVEKISNSDVTVTLLGESGVGKELVARAIHFTGRRRDKRFVAVNCSALPENLLESELFGHVKGAFTGAVTSKHGLFEYAEGGTLFLDEISDTPSSIQAKLLRVIEDRKIRPVGGNRELSVDVRIVTATSRNLKELIKRDAFREDLFYRINVVPITIPPLRARKEDIPLLINHFLKARKGLDAEALDIMVSYDWPGNVRELENMIERLVLFSRDSIIRASDLPEELREGIHGSPMDESYAEAKRKVIDSFNKNIIVHALSKSSGNVTLAAKNLSLDRANFQRLMRRYRINSSDYKDTAS